MVTVTHTIPPLPPLSGFVWPASGGSLHQLSLGSYQDDSTSLLDKHSGRRVYVLQREGVCVEEGGDV